VTVKERRREKKRERVSSPELWESLHCVPSRSVRSPTVIREVAQFLFDRRARELPTRPFKGSGRWAVLHFRNESDETGPYVAVALRYSN
jgi:hypothetical protein